MTLQIGDAIGNGIRRSATYSGGVLMVLTLVYQLVFLGSMNTVVREYVPAEAQQSGQLAFAFPIPVAAAAALGLLSMLFGMALYLAAVRALTRDVEELSTLPTELFTRRMGRALVSAIGANIVVSIAVMIGFILLFVPGVFLAVSFLFVVFAIAVEDERALDAMRRSWGLASGNRWRLFALLLITGVGIGVLSGLGSLLSVVSPVAGQLASIVISAVLAIVAYGILADAYLQLVSMEDEPDDGMDESPTDADVSESTPA